MFSLPVVACEINVIRELHAVNRYVDCVICLTCFAGYHVSPKVHLFLDVDSNSY